MSNKEPAAWKYPTLERENRANPRSYGARPPWTIRRAPNPASAVASAASSQSVTAGIGGGGETTLQIDVSPKSPKHVVPLHQKPLVDERNWIERSAFAIS